MHFQNFLLWLRLVKSLLNAVAYNKASIVNFILSVINKVKRKKISGKYRTAHFLQSVKE